MGDTKIQWTGKTWNPIRARNKATGKVGWFCEHVSEGCRNCYAETMNRNTYFGNGIEYKPAALDQVELFLDEKILQQPLHWRKPTMVFPCSMTDAFARFVKDEWIDQMMAVAGLAKQHTFQFLTKRADRMSRYFSDPYHMNRAREQTYAIDQQRAIHEAASSWPLPNVWLGTSVEDQETADERIPLLLRTPAAVRWISAEPMIGAVDLSRYLPCPWTLRGHDHPTERTTGLDWVVVGGESGSGARPCDIAWIRVVIEHCRAATVPVFVKQLGSNPVFHWTNTSTNRGFAAPNLTGKVESVRWLADKKGGDMNEWPEPFRVREYPNGQAKAAAVAEFKRV